ncbi:hypothetical protein Rhopal_004053-T1 [Rhodotorula paludigena]|uniref:Phosphatidic acid phosphatase type 2/haloperoxidase domain-containing protein n=1 Tax=Rhodotorula paludigena TaxID=86838 RepID=A0AAV5GLF9_9BASI|nr:hypothetical protein Rhopal_004053-T1 [Rhodotorula paludigena]
MASSPHPALPRPQLPLSKSSAPSNVAADVLKGDKDATQLAQASLEPPVLAVGRRDEAFYEACMPAWRFSIRQKLVASLDNEMSMLQEIQRQWRTPFRDEYFVKTSLLGTHTFFMVFLPLWYWFGYPNVGKGLLYVLAAGGYFTSVLKDACSVPRPYSPPVVRLSVGSHALEYGFPSTHSSNACSMALFFGELVFSRADAGWLGNAAAVVGLVLFAWSVTFGRLYTGMHSLMDVVVGSTIGVLVWLAYYLLCDTFDAATMGSGWTGTITSTVALLLLVTFHPEPAEECPCFEDAVAFLSVVGGVIVGQAWAPDPFSTHTYGYRWRDAAEVAMWSGAVLFKLVTGISAILVWRIIAKEACHLVLPPLFRFFSPLIELPRRHYLRATEYEAYPPNEHLNPVVVYMGIGWIASVGLPWVFTRAGVSV